MTMMPTLKILKRKTDLFQTISSRLRLALSFTASKVHEVQFALMWWWLCDDDGGGVGDSEDNVMMMVVAMVMVVMMMMVVMVMVIMPMSLIAFYMHKF